MNLPADNWAVEAKRMPLAFAQVREDPLIDAALVRDMNGPVRVCMIASGGDTAAFLASQVAEIHLVDLNAAQLELTRLKLYLLSAHSFTQRLELLGHAVLPAKQRAARMREIQDSLEIPSACFGDSDYVATEGVDYAGRYELLFRELARQLASGRERDAALDSCMRLDNLICLFGELATQNPVQPFWRHFAERLKWASVSHPNNPFFSQMVMGRFQPGESYDWHGLPKLEIKAALEYHHNSMDRALESLRPGSIELVHLSNILDWLNPQQATQTLELAARALRRGGLVVIRQLNSSLAIPNLGGHFRWSESLARSLHASDRSFFYRALHVGEKR